jgi:hypothetical protein
MYPGVYAEVIGWTYIQHDIVDRMPEFTSPAPHPKQRNGDRT